MKFPVKIALPFRLKLLLAFLAAAGTGIYISYIGVKNSAGPFSEQIAGAKLTARLDIAAAVMNAEINASLERTRLLAALPALRGILAGGSAGGQPEDKVLSGPLAAVGGIAANITGMDLADKHGRVKASLENENRGADLSRRPDFRFGIKDHYISAPRLNGRDLSYYITVPVLAAAGEKTGPLGALRCRFKAAPAPLAALDSLRVKSTLLALAKRGGQRIILTAGNEPARELDVKAAEASQFLPALEGRERASVLPDAGCGRALYASRAISGPDWVLAAKEPFSASAQPAAALLDRARLTALLAFTFLATAAFFAAGAITGPLRGLAREAETLLEECGMPAGPAARLVEPEALTTAISDAASTLKHHASRDLELETETEKLREEEADLKTQNDELEKLNKYLMEREIKISELKKEISELREKVGSSTE